MSTTLPKNWDDEFANSAYIAGAEKLPGQWAADAAAYRSNGLKIDEHRYGDHPRELFDVIWPDKTPKGLAVFLHGGFWIMSDKASWTHFAEGARANGWAVCLPQYILAPEARVGDITQQVGRAINMAATLIDGPIRIAGHSAGGHLVSRMVCEDSPLTDETQVRLEHTLSISGLHDLRPLIQTKMNEKQRIDMAEAQVESAALSRPHPDANITAWVGGSERPEFVRQSRILPLMWDGFDVQSKLVVDGYHNHFSVIDDLQKPDNAITKAFAP